MNRATQILVAVTLVLLATAAAPQMVKVQGYLSDQSGGTPVPANGTYTMTFDLYDAAAAGQLIASSGPLSVPVTDGIYDVELPFGTADYQQEERYVAITVNGELLAPRLRFLSTPYAYQTERAASSAEADVAAGVQPGAIVPASLAAGAVTLPALGISCAEGEYLVKSASGWACSPPPTVCSVGDFVYCYTGPPGTIDVGECRAGTRDCLPSGTGFGACVGQVLPTTETCDGLDNDCNGVIDDCVNSPPSQPVIQITPTSPFTTDTLTCTIVTPSDDPDGDPVTYRYRWTQNGVPRSEFTTETLPSSATMKNHTWGCIVTPTDGMDDGPQAVVGVTIQNSPPTMPTICDVLPSMNPSDTDDLTFLVDSSFDADGDPITYSVSWFVLGVPMPQYDGMFLIPALETTPGETWEPQGTPFDGTDFGTPCLGFALIGP